MHLLSPEQQVIERELEQVTDFLTGPVIANDRRMGGHGMFHHDKGPVVARIDAIFAAAARKRQLFTGALVDNMRANQCLLCLAPGRNRCLCPDCLRDLPWLDQACRSCALPLSPGSADAYCADCRLTPPPWQEARALFRYEFPVDRLVAALKYHGRLALADAFGMLLAENCLPERRPDLLLPVPLHDRRLRQRGYHQTALLTRAMAAQLDIPVDSRHLRRVHDTAMQKTLDAGARLANLHHAFVWQGPSLRGRRVMLIDDVMTTGATLQALCPALIHAGAAAIDVALLARTLPP